jgi:type II secretory pathway pseudopilin PulG
MKNTRGFTYLGLMFVIAMLGLSAAAASTLWSVLERREREQDLLFAGRQVRTALRHYLAASPAGPGQPPPAYPNSLEQLLLDRRFLVPVRHLRQLYPDPMGGGADWGLVRNPQGGIVGVFSLSQRAPIQHEGFGPGEPFNQARSYRDWVFGDLPHD